MQLFFSSLANEAGENKAGSRCVVSITGPAQHPQVQTKATVARQGVSNNGEAGAAISPAVGAEERLFKYIKFQNEQAPFPSTTLS